MWNFNNKPQIQMLNDAIDDLLIDLRGGVGEDHEHATHTTATENVIKLMKLKEELKSSYRPSPDALVAAAASVTGILLVLHYEKLDAVTSKAFAFLGKLK